jgi:SAM-dependent methyltransferase
MSRLDRSNEAGAMAESGAGAGGGTEADREADREAGRGAGRGAVEVAGRGEDLPEPRRKVAGRWQDEAVGRRYAATRFHSARRAGRDARLVTDLLLRVGGLRGDEAEGPAAWVLDAPCGTGRLAPTLAARTPHLVGLDTSRAMLDAWPEVPAHTHRVAGSAFALPFRAGAFDGAVACRFLHHLAAAEDRRAALAELARVTRRWVIVSFWDARSWTAWRRTAGGREPRDARVAVSAATLAADLAAAGLEPVARAHSLRFVSAQTFVLAFHRVR